MRDTTNDAPVIENSVGLKTQTKTALIGWSLAAIEAIEELGRPYVVVGPPDFEPHATEHGIEFVSWHFEKLNDQSTALYERLKELGVHLAIPLYEDTVEWAGALNARFYSDPRAFNRALLFRDKGMMKRKAQIAGMHVGVFEEAHNTDDVVRFLKRVNQALLKLDSDMNDPIHVKPLDQSGSIKHRLIHNVEDVETLEEDDFPALMESHLDGQEFSCEAFIHDGKVQFLNITEYVRLGHSNFVPASPSLEAHRPVILREIQKLIDAFEFKYGMIHPEYFITKDGTLHFGEVAARVPGGHIFELIERAHQFNPFQALILCSDPATTEEELRAFFPDESSTVQYAGCLMTYPQKHYIERLEFPKEIEEHPYFEKHNMFTPSSRKVAERIGFGNHYGTVYFYGDDSEQMRDLLKKYEDYEFYV